MIKGRTKIELTDVHTGEVEVIEEENMVTNALQYIFNPMGYIKAGSKMFGENFVNYYATLTGGLLLLDKTQEENADHLFLDVKTNITGCAVYDQQNTSNQGVRGNFNATETEVDTTNKIIKYVYDFDTAEGNGTIASVALTHAYGGYTNRGCAEEPVRGTYPFFFDIGTGALRMCGKNSGINAYDRTSSYSTSGTKYHWIYLIDATKDLVYYFSIDSATSITIRGYRANINTISLFDTPATGRRLMFEKTLTLEVGTDQKYFSYNYDEESQKLYVVSPVKSDYTVKDNDNYVITEIDIAHEYAIKQYMMTNKCGSYMRIAYDRESTWCYDGYIYFTQQPSPYTIYRQEIGNSANVQAFPMTLRQCFPVMARDKRIYFAYPSGYSGAWALYIIETDSFTMKYPETITLYDEYHRQYVPVLGAPMTYFATSGTSEGTFVMRSDYLATINNLSSPVVKTADKTMKITYTLTEE